MKALRPFFLTVLMGLGLFSPVVAQEPVRDPNGNPSADLQLDSLAAEIATLRELTPAAPIERFYITPTDWQVFTLATLEAQYSEERALHRAWFEYAFHFAEGVTPALPPDRAPFPADFYDFQRDQLYIVNGGQALSGLRGMLLAFAYTQALNDQRHDLGNLLAEYPADTDQGLALRAVINGDALFTQQTYLDQLLTNDPNTAFTLLRSALLTPQNTETATPYQQASARFTYETGRAFIQYIHNTGGWAAVDALYDNLPVSTEQILHPIRYLEGDTPVTVEMTPLTDENLLYLGVVGELTLREHLQQQLEPAQAFLLAEGWGGDAFYLYGQADQLTLIWRIAWDTTRDAADFNDIYPLYLERQLGIPGFPQEDTRLLCWNSVPAACLVRGEQTSLIVYAASIEAVKTIVAAQPEVQ